MGPLEKTRAGSSFRESCGSGSWIRRACQCLEGLGAGSDHNIGEKAALESIDEIIMEIEDINMLFIATGMGGGTGTGAAPIIAKKAKDLGTNARGLKNIVGHPNSEFFNCLSGLIFDFNSMLK